MAYVITDACWDVKDASCVGVCPVDCIHPGPDEPGFAEAKQLYINPDECVDCDACADVCPMGACVDLEVLAPEQSRFAAINAEFYSAG
ncbi:4Fe-4S dicluster domain-containing protein [Pseudonocardia dioxanivorans]|jgi:NAD-dependent dihydropyrimidine dehydrogenase PreA subunit|uniref:4Fe-4S dicluster domain-containing protein n=1 Tax=Pseudonocardia dioxanivorans TaxID=240495 RepID=UPI000CD3093D|nr:ferredoxin family protein [Pseudonocardia dioxanivorans]